MQRSNAGAPAVCIYKPTHRAAKWFTVDYTAAWTLPHAVLDYTGLLNRPLEKAQ